MTRAVRTVLLIMLALAPGTTSLRAQLPVVVRPTALEGVLSFVWGDPEVRLGVPRYAASLRMDGAPSPVALELGGADEALIVAARDLSGHRVKVGLREAWAGLREDGAPTPASVKSIAGVGASELMSAAAPTWARTTRPYAVILCKFADVSTEPLPASRFRERYGAGVGGAESFYSEVSNGRMSIAGTTVFGWYTLPSARSAYVGASADLVKLATECAAAADADVDFRQFGGIAFHFNANLDCCSWGGSISLALDGPARSFPTMWMPPWAGAGVTWHEMGHSFGLPHSGSDDCSNNSWWDVMSVADAGIYVDPALGSGGAHFVAYHKELLGLIPRGRIAEAGSSGWSGWLAPSALPSSQATGYQLVNIPLLDRPGVHVADLLPDAAPRARLAEGLHERLAALEGERVTNDGVAHHRETGLGEHGLHRLARREDARLGDGVLGLELLEALRQELERIVLVGRTPREDAHLAVGGEGAAPRLEHRTAVGELPQAEGVEDGVPLPGHAACRADRRARALHVRRVAHLARDAGVEATLGHLLGADAHHLGALVGGADAPGVTDGASHRQHLRAGSGARDEHALPGRDAELPHEVEVVRHEAGHPLVEIPDGGAIPGSRHAGEHIRAERHCEGRLFDRRLERRASGADKGRARD